MKGNRIATLIATKSIHSIAVIRDGRYPVEVVNVASVVDGRVSIVTNTTNLTFKLEDVTLFEIVNEGAFNFCVAGHREEYTLFL